MSAGMEPIVRRAILDLLCDIGGEQSDQGLKMLLSENGHPVSRRDVNAAMRWLAGAGLIAIDELGSFLTAQLLEDGEDASRGRLVVHGVGRLRTSAFSRLGSR